MILEGDLQAFGQGDGKTPFNDLIGEQHPVEGLGIEGEEGQTAQGSGIEAVAAVG